MAERKNKQNVRWRKSEYKKRIPRIAMNTLKDKAEKSTTKLNNIHAEKSEQLTNEMNRLRNTLTGTAAAKN